MIRRLLVLALIAGVGVAVYLNRHQLAVLAGLSSPEVQIAGDWHIVSSGFKEDSVYTFADDLVSRDGEVVGQYTFKGLQDIEVTIDQETRTYRVEFPDDATMDWYREIKGEPRLVRRWRR